MKKYLIILLVFFLIGAAVIGITVLLKKDRESTPDTTPKTEPNTQVGSAPKPNNYLFDFYNDEKITAFADGFYTDTPVEMKYSRAYSPDYITKDKELIAKVFQALKNVRVGEETDLRITDSEIYYTFFMSDGRSFTIGVESQDMLVYKGKNYSISSAGELFKIAMPE